MITSVNYRFFRQSRNPTSKFPRQVKTLCIDQSRHDSIHWQQCSNGINYALRSASDLTNLTDLYQILFPGTTHYFHNGAVAQSDTQPGLRGNGSTTHNCVPLEYLTYILYSINGGILPSTIEWINCMSGGPGKSNT